MELAPFIRVVLNYLRAQPFYLSPQRTLLLSLIQGTHEARTEMDSGKLPDQPNRDSWTTPRSLREMARAQHRPHRDTRASCSHQTSHTTFSQQQNRVRARNSKFTPALDTGQQRNFLLLHQYLLLLPSRGDR